MLFHHSNSQYQEAASAAAQHARTKLEGLIRGGRDRAAHVIDLIESEVPSDYVVPSHRLQFDARDNLRMRFTDGRGNAVDRGLHDHAVQQAADKAGMPRRYASNLASGGLWQRELLAHNLNQLFHHDDGKYLVRSVNGEVRGFLSNRFRRMDSRPIVEAFAAACQQFGAVPVEGYHLQTRIALKALLPVVFEPVENEVLAVGVVLQNSDYGHGALSLRTFILRLWCTNFAIAEELLRQVHLGRRLDENVQFSEQTHRLDTDTMVSATKDIVTSALAPEAVDRVLGGVRQANELEVSPTQIATYLKKHFRKDEARAITDAFQSADVVNMPPGQTRYRLSNAVSWVAGQQDDDGRRLEMQQVAGQLLMAA